jgi:hypothetical protein
MASARFYFAAGFLQYLLTASVGDAIGGSVIVRLADKSHEVEEVENKSPSAKEQRDSVWCVSVGLTPG